MSLPSIIGEINQSFSLHTMNVMSVYFSKLALVSRGFTLDVSGKVFAITILVWVMNAKQSHWSIV